ncbi:MAG: thiol protease/hemagglutinin PrtT [Bacteroidetes bacterium]|nr:thiol protease/hemagglutinin PrtT [Bacteroidota bacterium]
MKYFVLCCLLAFWGSFAFAAPVGVAQAEQVAGKFMASVQPQPYAQPVSLDLWLTSSSSEMTGAIAYYYTFTLTSGGFVLVAGDDRVYPIIAYALDGDIRTEAIPPATQKWLEACKEEIRYAIENQLEPDATIALAWAYPESIMGTQATKKTVSPLLATKWNQGKYYNGACPGGSVTGCVATAMAQVMKYWDYPKQGQGFHSYDHSQYGTLSANFGSTTYQWTSMPNSVTSTNSAVATLMYHCGVSVEMDYSPESSGAYVISSRSATTNCAEYAFYKYFGYNDAEGVERADYSESSWISMLKDELDEGRPVLYAGFGGGGGHAFVCDGYDASDYFHFNWGWGGVYDGYFKVNALNPSGVGTGGGSGGYNSGQQAIIGIEPPSNDTSSDVTISLYEYLDLYPSTISYGDEFELTTNFANTGKADFSGDYALAAFDEDLNFVDFVDTLSDYQLRAGYTYSYDLTFSTTGMFILLPGTYYLATFYRHNGGEWKLVEDYSWYTNQVTLEVEFESDIELYSEIVLTPGTTLVRTKKASVNANIANTGSSSFYGSFAFNLYNLDGTFAQNIDVIDESGGLSSGYAYTKPITFTCDEITVPPGTYLLALMYKRSSSGSYYLAGSSYYTNPIKVTVQEPEMEQDVYEMNNTATNAYALSASFSGSSATVATSNANIHKDSDVDYFKLILESGYKYTIDAAVHDAYESSAGDFTVDALISYSTDGTTWSDAYDHAIFPDINAKSGDLYFKIAPYFAGELGTYKLDIRLTRELVTDISQPENTHWLSVYPNPVTDVVYFKSDVLPNEGFTWEIVDALGQQVASGSAEGNSDLENGIDVTHLSSGSYALIARWLGQANIAKFNVVK